MYVLASGSPRRKELMKNIVSEFDVEVSGCDEIIPDGTPVEKIPEILALQKASAVAFKRPGDTIIGSDTVVVLDGKIFGKPKDANDARRMLRELSGREHFVYTGVAIIEGGCSRSFVSKTSVTFYDLSDDLINKYIESGEPMDKAGAYGIQGSGSLLVKKIDGDYYTVVGFPVAAIARFLNII